MLDNQLFMLLQTEIVDRAPLRGVTDSAVMLRYQPTQQGRPTGSTVWMTKGPERPFGTPLITYPQGLAGIEEREEQSMETTIQFSVTRPSALKPSDLTHGDILRRIRGVVQSRAFMRSILEAGASVLRVPEIRNTPFENDRGEWEQGPMFDLIVKHTDVFVNSIPQISKYEFRLTAVPNLAA